jgi:hypothetical protein
VRYCDKAVDQHYFCHRLEKIWLWKEKTHQRRFIYHYHCSFTKKFIFWLPVYDDINPWWDRQKLTNRHKIHCC